MPATLATLIEGRRPRVRPIGADRLERVLAIGAGVLMLAVVAALARGHAQWQLVPALVWAHLLTIMVALGLTPVLLLGRRGDARHRWLGRVWAGSMFLTAALSFGVRQSSGHLSLIHLLSAWTLIQVPWIWYTARTHKVEQHRGAVRGMVIGALLVAGFFTFPFHRLLGMWLFR